MIKFAGKTAEGQLVGLGLDAENIRRLQEGQPILFGMSIEDEDNRHEPIKLRFLLYYGANQEEMARDLQEFIGPDTQVEGTP